MICVGSGNDPVSSVCITGAWVNKHDHIWDSQIQAYLVDWKRLMLLNIQWTDLKEAMYSS